MSVSKGTARRTSDRLCIKFKNWWRSQRFCPKETFAIPQLLTETVLCRCSSGHLVAKGRGVILLRSINCRSDGPQSWGARIGGPFRRRCFFVELEPLLFWSFTDNANSKIVWSSCAAWPFLEVCNRAHFFSFEDSQQNLPSLCGLCLGQFDWGFLLWPIAPYCAVLRGHRRVVGIGPLGCRALGSHYWAFRLEGLDLWSCGVLWGIGFDALSRVWKFASPFFWWNQEAQLATENRLGQSGRAPGCSVHFRQGPHENADHGPHW